ncbi:hypothetical protein Q5P01_002301 [Channa striata]|uniref:Uncharacterized protein n=1 Tax=Channa striata TaxID=64152 RepID=A0AA88NT21_CHASR|nr:hypothetical protein Q5P01_002301 [Channa striata]
MQKYTAAHLPFIKQVVLQIVLIETEMAAAAAAALSRSRGVAGVRRTKGLFFMFALLVLVGFASSLIDKDTLKTMKEQLQMAEKEADKMKENVKSGMSKLSDFVDKKSRK